MQNNQKPTSNVLYVLNITLRLVAICAVIALLVATVNYFAAPVIKANSEKATAEAIGRLFGGAEVSTTEINASVPEAYNGIVDTVYHVAAPTGEAMGYCVLLSPTGFKGEVNLIAAFDTDAFITGVEITATNDETSGIGTKVKDESFTAQFIETSGEVSTNVSDYIISGATKTSKPVTEAVFAAKNVVSGMVATGAAVPATNEEPSEGGEINTTENTEKEADKE